MDYVIDAIEKNNEDNSPIVVTESEYQRIVSMFRIKGIVKLDNGEVAPQRRGRPRKMVSPFDSGTKPANMPDYPSMSEIFEDGDSTEK